MKQTNYRTFLQQPEPLGMVPSLLAAAALIVLATCRPVLLVHNANLPPLTLSLILSVIFWSVAASCWLRSGKRTRRLLAGFAAVNAALCLFTLNRSLLLAELDAKSLVASAALGDAARVRLLLAKRRAHVNVRDAEGRTALMAAAENGCTEVMGILLAYGADRDITDKHGRTAFLLAQDSSYDKEASELLDAYSGNPKNKLRQDER